MNRWQVFVSWIVRIFRSRYVMLLEEEVERLRADNRALVNSLLGTAGVPPIEDSRSAGPQRRIIPSPAVRGRRSWHQIAAWREAEAARSARHTAASSSSSAT